MRILAFDQATTTGFAVLEKDNLIHTGKFTLEGSLVGKCLLLQEQAELIIKEWAPDLVVVEEIQLQANTLTFKSLAYIQASILMLLESMGQKYEVVSASSWKSTNKVKGRTRAEQKRNAQDRVFQLFGIKATQDEADAVLLAQHLFNVNTFF